MYVEAIRYERLYRVPLQTVIIDRLKKDVYKRNIKPESDPNKNVGTLA
jgi:hypothetical protein